MSKNLPSAIPVVKTLLESKKMELAQALPKHIPVDKLIRVFVTQLSANPKLQECTQQSLFASLLKSCLYGLEPDGREAALVPYWSGAKKCFECQLITMVIGEVKLARNSGEINDIYAEVVYEKDTFKIEYGLNRGLNHTPNFEDDGFGDDSKIIGAYAVYVLKDGTKSFMYMTKKQIDKRRPVVKPTKDGYVKETPWDNWYAEQCKKTLIKAVLKFAPKSVDKDYINTDVLPDLGMRIMTDLKLPTPQQEAENSIEPPKRVSESVDTETGEVTETEILDEELEANLEHALESDV